jgi:riboflavin synthase
MFSGIIEEKGRIEKMIALDKGYRFVIKGKKALKKTKLGDSIAVNGICLTVVKKTWSTFEVDVMQETIDRTALSQWKESMDVNLERALVEGQRNGGHHVLGHVDTVGKVVSFVDEGIATRVTLSFDPKWSNYMIEKGSVALDGISLTLTKAEQGFLEVSLIPHTKTQTTLMQKKVGDLVNIEVDIMGKYIEKWMGPRR